MRPGRRHEQGEQQQEPGEQQRQEPEHEQEPSELQEFPNDDGPALRKNDGCGTREQARGGCGAIGVVLGGYRGVTRADDPAADPALLQADPALLQAKPPTGSISLRAVPLGLRPTRSPESG